MAKPLRRPAFYRRLLRTLLLSFLIPALVATLLLSTFQMHRAKQRLQQEQTLNSARLMSVLGSQLDTAVQMAFHCANDSFVVGLSKRTYDVLDFASLSVTLRTLKAANSYIEDILVYYAGNPMIYTTDGIYPVKQSPTGLALNGMLMDEYTADMSRCFAFSRAAISRAGKTRVSLAYLYSDLVNPSIKVMVTLNPRTLGYGENSTDEEQWIVVNQRDGTVLLSHGVADTLATEARDRLMRDPEALDMHLSGATYLSAVQTSDIFGLYYLSLLPVSRVFPTFISEAVLVLCVGLVICLLATLMIFRVVNRTYAPVKKLYSSVKPGENIDNGDEFGVIGSTLDHLQNQVTAQGLTIQNQIPAVRMHLLSRLFNGAYPSREDFNYIAASSGMSLTYPYYLCAMTACSTQDERENMVLVMERAAGDKMELYGCPTLDPNLYLFILCTAEPTDAQRFLVQTHQMLHARLGPSFSVYVSTCCSDFHRLGQAALECRTLHETCGMNGELNLFHNDQRDMQQLLNASGEMEPILRALRQAICNGSAEDARRCLSRFDRKVSKWELSSFVRQCVSYDLINCVLSAMNELLNLQEAASTTPLDLSGFPDFRTHKDMGNITEELFTLITNLLNRHSGSGSNAQGKPNMEAILGYIWEHYTSYDFSVKQVAEYADMSLSAFSQFFRDRQGVTAIDYVLHRRIEAAKEKLGGTNMLVSEIVYAIGYVSVPSFVTKFKRVTGMTPGEYRDQVRAASS